MFWKRPRVDFLLIYEIKQRDLENFTLLKKELERRGYKVSMQNMFDLRPVRAKVTAGSIDDDNLLQFHRTPSKSTHKFINMKPEQIFNNSADTDKDFSLTVRGQARETLNIAWGENSVRRYTEVFGLDPKNVYKTGHITMDLLREEFRSYFKSKEELCREFSLDPSKKLYLYISSFVWDSVSKSVLLENRAQHSGGDASRKISLSVESKIKTIEWFDNILPSHPDCEFVYRPHPAEMNSESLSAFERMHKNFHVISAYSVREWIVSADKIYTWFSTSIGEVFAAKRNCSILRPVKIPGELEIEIYNNAEFIESYKDFVAHFDCISNDFADFPVSKEEMGYYYYDPRSSYSFERYADAFEKVLNDDYYYIKDLPKIKKYNKHGRFKTFCQDCIARSRIAALVAKKNTFLEKRIAMYRFRYARKKKNVPSKAEIEEINKRIDDILKFRIKRIDNL